MLKLYIAPKVQNSFYILKCTKIAAARAAPQTTLGDLTAIQIPMMYVVGNQKNGYEKSLLIESVGLLGCVPERKWK